jgi:hypothetical protein
MYLVLEILNTNKSTKHSGGKMTELAEVLCARIVRKKNTMIYKLCVGC